MADTFVIHGLDALLAKFKAIKYETRYKSGRFALRKAAQVVRDAARQKALALDDAETAAVIAKNITERWNGKLFQRTGDLGFRVGVLGGVFGKLQGDVTGVYGDKFTKVTRKKGALGGDLPGGDTRHWGYLEFGTEKMAAQPFMRPAMENNIDRVVSVFVKEYGIAIDRAIAKAAKQ